MDPEFARSARGVACGVQGFKVGSSGGGGFQIVLEADSQIYRAAMRDVFNQVRYWRRSGGVASAGQTESERRSRSFQCQPVTFMPSGPVGNVRIRTPLTGLTGERCP